MNNEKHLAESQRMALKVARQDDAMPPGKSKGLRLLPVIGGFIRRMVGGVIGRNFKFVAAG